MFGIGKHVVDEDDSGLIKVAVLGNSKKVAQGDAVIALGNIFGYADGMSYALSAHRIIRRHFSTENAQ